MRKCRMTRIVRFCRGLTAMAIIGLSSNGWASTAPIFDAAASSASETHIVGTPSVAGSPYSATVTIGTPSLPQAPIVHTFYFPSVKPTGGITIATNGLAETTTATSVQLGFASGTGVTQTDPAHAETASTLGCNFSAVWDIAPGTTFGPPLAGNFSVPIGAHVGAGGSASFAFDVHLDVLTQITGKAPSLISDIRPSYANSITYNTAGTYLTSFTAPAGLFNPSSITNPGNPAGETVQLIMTGAFFFSADNNDAPTFIEFPTVKDFPQLASEPAFDFAPTMGTEVLSSLYEPKPDNTTGTSKSAESISPTAGNDSPTPEPSVSCLLLGTGVFLMASRKARTHSSTPFRR